MDKQIDEMQQSMAKVLGEIELLVIEDNKDKALELIRTTKKNYLMIWNPTDNSIKNLYKHSCFYYNKKKWRCQMNLSVKTLFYRCRLNEDKAKLRKLKNNLKILEAKIWKQI